MYGKFFMWREIIEGYYGEYVDKVDMFIGFGCFSIFDFLLFSLGKMSLYFIVVFLYYMIEIMFWRILYDYIYFCYFWFKFDYLVMLVD